MVPCWHNRGMTRFLIRWLVMTIAVAVTVLILPGMHVIGDPPIFGFAAFALFMALINASIKPIVHLLALPFSILSLGLVALIINWLFMRLASWLAIGIFGVGVDVGGFWWSVFASIIIAIVSSIAASITGE
jgi:putative membrane protein